jgi:uncharacterized protein
LPQRFSADRDFSTAIYFLLDAGNFSPFHRIKSDECWHFYTGEPLLIFVFQQNGILEQIYLASDINKGQLFQYLVSANCWFASRPAPGSRFFLWDAPQRWALILLILNWPTQKNC